MSILKPAETTQACAKINISGFSGAGKTFAAVQIARGILERMGSKKPLGFFDTETGSDFFIERLKALGISMLQAKTRAFSDLIDGLREAQKLCDVVIIDSATHYWRELTESYMQSKAMQILMKKKVIDSIEKAEESAKNDSDYAAWLDDQIREYKPKTTAFSDWNYLKGEWGIFTDFFVNSPIHMIVCGRGGYEYDYLQNEDGKWELRKTGTKMKAEAEFGFEPSLVLECERLRKSQLFEDPKLKGFLHRITVLKDRWSVMNGAELDFDPEANGDGGENPVFTSLLPHIELLNLGGEQLGVDVTRNSSSRFKNGNGEWERIKKDREILLEEIQGVMVEQFPGQSKEEKTAKVQILFDVFGTRAWASVETKPVPELRAGLRTMVNKINELRVEAELDELTMPSAALEPEEQTQGEEVTSGESA